MSDYFTGRVERVVFQNDAQSFYVLNMSLDNSSKWSGKTIVRGAVPGLDVKVGCWFGFEAHWETHEKYGKQLVIDAAPVVRGEWDAETALKLLQNHGVGAASCKAIYDHFGDDQLHAALSDPNRLKEVPGFSEFTAQHISSRWVSVRALFQSLDFLADSGLPKKKIDQIYAHFGDDAERILSQNPWDLIKIDGITFDQADEVARKLGLSLTDENRIRGAALYVCKIRRGMGHLYLRSGELVAGMQQYIPEIEKPRLAEVLKQLHDENLLYIDNKTREGVTAIYEPWYYTLESESAALLANRAVDAKIQEDYEKEYLSKLGEVGSKTLEAYEQGASLRGVAKTAIGEFLEGASFSLSEKQMEGAVNALTESVSVLTGLPGTGKTTTLRVVVKLLQDTGIPFVLVAPTGIAAKRLSSVVGAEASTIHRAFGAKGLGQEGERESTYAGVIGGGIEIMDSDGSQEFWGFSAQQPHPARVVIIDESSMVDQHLLFRVLTCTAKTCRVVFVGDAAQLPSVGPGNVLRDIIHSGKFPVTDLQEIFRQDEASDIVIAAHAINRGEVPPCVGVSKDFSFLDVRSEDIVLETILTTVKKLYDRKANFQVLSPRHSGTLGVTNLNVRIRDLINPKAPGLREMKLGSEMVREGDRIMISRNNYNFNVFNGDVGKIVRLDPKNRTVEVKIHGPPVVHVKMPFKEAVSHLRLAYCMTVHKSQGQEYDVILMPWVLSFRHQLLRNLLYTAITRARKKVILVGHTKALEKAIQNNRVDARNTLFPERILNALA